MTFNSSGTLCTLTLCLIGVGCALTRMGDPCSKIECKAGRVCRSTASSSAPTSTISAACVCAAPDFCRRQRAHPRPVCGSDGRLYGSHCELHRIACLTGRRLRPSAADCLKTNDSSKSTSAPTDSSAAGRYVAKTGCTISDTKAAVAAVKVDLMRRQCLSAGLADGCSDYSSGGKEAAHVADRIFAQLDSNSDRRLSQSELMQKLGSVDCIKEVVDRMLGPSKGSIDRQNFAKALDLPEATTMGTRRVQMAAVGSKTASFACPLGLVGPEETVIWQRRGAVKLEGRNSTEFTIENPMEFDSGVYECCSSLWPTLCASVALSVVAPPFVQVRPSMLVRREGESAKLNCDVNGGGLGLQGGVSWLFNGVPVGEVEADGKPAVRRTDSGATLSIAKLEKGHTGMYTCRTSNVAGVAEFAATVYVRLPTETDYTSYPLSPPSVISLAAVAFHAGGCSLINPLDCSVASAASADFDDVTLCENLINCEWGAAVSAGRHLVYAAQPSLGRLLAMQPQRWLAFEAVQLNCRPTMMAYRQQTDQLWVACTGTDGVFVIDSASLLAGVPNGQQRHRRRLARRWSSGSIGDEKKFRVLRLPESRSPLLVAVDETAAAVLVIDVGDGRRAEDAKLIGRFSLRFNDSELKSSGGWVDADRADLLVQGGTLLLHTSSQHSRSPGDPEPPILAVDLRSGKRVERRLFPGISASEGSGDNDQTDRASAVPTGRVFVSEDNRHLLHLAGTNVYVYEVRSTGELSLLLHDVAGVGIRSAKFQSSPDGSLKILARTQRDGAVLVVDLKARVFQLVFDENLDRKPNLSAPSFGDLALVHSSDGAVFFNTTGLTVTNCKESLFVDLQTLHWLEN